MVEYKEGRSCSAFFLQHGLFSFEYIVFLNCKMRTSSECSSAEVAAKEADAIFSSVRAFKTGVRLVDQLDFHKFIDLM